ncbi:MAG: hypothetical protein ACYS1A_16385 [Planctomycetota bacterium]|jgi:hypothetical protein
MKVITFLFIIAFLLGMMGVSQAQEAGKSGQGEILGAMPIIRSLFHGFDVLDIGRGLEEEIDFELSTIFTSKHMRHGLDLLNDNGAFIPIGTVIFGESGFIAKIIDVYPTTSGFETSVERNYAGFYTGALLQETSWATNFTLNYFYYGKPKVPGNKMDAQEFGSTFFWPRLMAVGNGYITPSYYLGYIWPSTSNSILRGCEGFIHVFGLGYDFAIPDFWPGGQEQAFRLFGDITYNDGYGSPTIEHDWSHAIIGMSTNLKKGNLTITPSLNYQVSMEDSVNNENELWCVISATCRF